MRDLVNDSADVPLALRLPVDDRARRLAQRILADPGESSTLSALAEGTGASLRTLQRRFHADTGMPLDTWRLRARMHHALVLLAERRSITEVALACGYATPAAFSFAFKRVFRSMVGSQCGPDSIDSPHFIQQLPTLFSPFDLRINEGLI
ncbi:MAG: helix-turn-helix transcriptional regulator, partial [Pseudomonadales bacterium]|nr:helix-turn-helix transcriptional regulator [Pseudomonadales bacterium]